MTILYFKPESRRLSGESSGESPRFHDVALESLEHAVPAVSTNSTNQPNRNGETQRFSRFSGTLRNASPWVNRGDHPVNHPVNRNGPLIEFGQFAARFCVRLARAGSLTVAA